MNGLVTLSGVNQALRIAVERQCRTGSNCLPVLAVTSWNPMSIRYLVCLGIPITRTPDARLRSGLSSRSSEPKCAVFQLPAYCPKAPKKGYAAPQSRSAVSFGGNRDSEGNIFHWPLKVSLFAGTETLHMWSRCLNSRYHLAANETSPTRFHGVLALMVLKSGGGLSGLARFTLLQEYLRHTHSRASSEYP